MTAGWELRVSVPGSSGCLCSHTVVCFPSLSSRECATKCFLSQTSWSCGRHVPYVLQSLLLLGKIHALMFLASKRWFLLQKPYCSSITKFNLLFMDLWNHFWRKLIFLCVHRWIASSWKCAASVCCLPDYRCWKQWGFTIQIINKVPGWLWKVKNKHLKTEFKEVFQKDSR